MFAVIFEVRPKPENWDDYLGHGRMLRPEIERIDGFIDNVRYRSLRRDGWILSLSTWRDEKALVRWRTQAKHHETQAEGRARILADYHLRVAQVVSDTHVPAGQQLVEQRFDATEVGDGTALAIVEGKRTAGAESTGADDLAAALGSSGAEGAPIGWDLYDAILTPGDLALVATWQDAAGAAAFVTPTADARLRRLRIIRDYGMFDRREAPQYYPDAAGRPTVHA